MPRCKPRLRTLAVFVCVAELLLSPLATRVHADDSSATVHVVQAGETLSGIANSVGVDSSTLSQLNGLGDANVLAVGQSLRLPSTTAPTAPAPAATVPASAQRTYTVAAGDTLWSIAEHLSTTTAALLDANDLDDPDHVVVGAQLAVPASAGPAASSGTAAPAGAAAAAPAPARAAASGQSDAKRTLLVSYTVQPGETLDHIAHQFDVPAATIVQASGLDDPNRLLVGTVLKVPLAGREHVVKPGETLSDIAAQEKVDLGSLVDFNALDDPALIRVGQVVLVPAAPDVQTAGAAASAAQAASQASAAVGPGPTTAPATASPSATPAAPQAAATQPASTPAATPSATQPASTSAPTSAASASAAASPSSTPSPPAKGTPTPKPSQTPVPRAPVAVVAPPAGAPSDGLAGAGLKLLGTPYVWGGSSPTGFDCSGFVWYVARQLGKSLGRGLFGEYNGGSHPSRDSLQPGDLVFFQNTYSAGLSHNGIYIGNGQFVHAADENAGVTISSLGTAYWSAHWFGATRLS